MITKGTLLRRNTLCLAAVSTVLCNAALAAQPDEKKEEHLYLSEQFLYDDNLFRDAETTDIPPGAVAREDYVNRITLGLGNDFHMGQQTLRLKGRVFDARYQDNDYLDYTGGDASAAFDFNALTALSGRLSASAIAISARSESLWIGSSVSSSWAPPPGPVVKGWSSIIRL